MAGEVIVRSALDPAEFSPITIDAAELEVLTQTTGVPDDVESVTLRFEGPRLRARLLQLSAHAARRIAGGQPRRNLSGFRDAIADPGAQLVEVEWQEGEARVLTGIFTIAEAQVGPESNRRQSFTLVVFPCDRLRFYGLGEDDFQEVDTS